jgi:hypothetical protein
LWNPSIDKNGVDLDDPTYNYDCSLQTSISYCMGIAKPTPYWEGISNVDCKLSDGMR